MAYFCARFVLNVVFLYNHNSIEIHQECMSYHRDWLACEKSITRGVYLPKSLEQVSPN